MARLALRLNDGTVIQVPISVGDNISTTATLSGFRALPNGGYTIVTHQNCNVVISDTPLSDFAATIANRQQISFTVGNLSDTYIRTSINDPTTLQFGNATIDGSTCGRKTSTVKYDKLCAVQFDVEGVTMIALGGPPISSSGLGNYNYLFVVSVDALGKQAFAEKGGPDTPPGDGADANAGYGAYDFDSPGGLGSSMPSSPSLPVSENGRGLHAYTMDAAAYQVLGDALWGVGDSGSSIAFADMWQKWQNYKFNPTAGIISCIRLPDVFTPDRTGLTDTNIKLSGTWAVKGGQFSSIAGCKPADVSPISADVLTCSIPEQYGSWLDYDGGIEITLDLPFCGRMQIDPSACVNGGVSVQYRCDPCNGNCAAFVFTTDRNGVTQLYNVAYGNCAFQVPLTGHDDGQVQMLGSFAGSAAALAGAAASPALAAGAVVGAATTMMMRRETTQTVGAPSGSVAYVGNVSPTIIISYAHPVKSPGTLYPDTEGQPCEYGGKIGSYTGFTIMHNVHAEIPAASAEEQEEIERLLESGVFL